MIHQKFVEILRDEIAKAEKLIVHGGHVRNFEMFQCLIGRVKGLQDSLDMYLGLIKGEKNGK